MRFTASKSPGRGGREAGLDDVDLEADQLSRDFELLGRRQAGARGLLPVAQGGVEDPNGPRRDTAGTGYAGAHRDEPPAPAPAAGVAAGEDAPRCPAAAWAWPACTTTGFRKAIWARSSAPITSTGWS